MTAAWPAICTAVALGLLLVLIIHYKFQAFAALLVVSLGLGLAAGMPPLKVVEAIGIGTGDILKNVALILGLGSMLGRMLEASGAAQVIARTLLDSFGPSRASLAILVAGYIIGIPTFFNVGFLLLMPIMWQVQRDTGRSLLHFGMPLAFSLATMHSLVPPHPGIVVAVGNLHADTVQTIIFGSLLAVPVLLIGWFGPGRWWANQVHVEVPAALAAKAERDVIENPPSVWLALLIVLLPLILGLVGFAAKLWGDPKSPLTEWLRFIGDPLLALAIPAGLAFVLLGVRRGLTKERLSRVAGDALQDVGGMALMIGTCGAFSEVIKASGAGNYIAGLARDIPISPVAVCFLVATLLRVALGSATASIAAASATLSTFVANYPGQETLLVLAVANGVTIMTQPADSGFWLVKEYCNLSVRDVMIRYNLCRATMAASGLAILLVVEAWWFR